MTEQFKPYVEPIEPMKTWAFAPAIEYKGKEYDSITMRAPTMNEVQTVAALKDTFEQTKKMCQMISGYPQPVMELASFYILDEAFKYCMGFSSERLAAYYALKSSS